MLRCAGGPGARVQRRGGGYKPGGVGAGLSQRSPTSRARRQGARHPNHRARHREGPAAAPARLPPPPAGRARCARCGTAPCCPRRASHQGCAARGLHWLRGWDRSWSARSQGAGRGGAERLRGSAGSRGREGGSPPQPPPRQSPCDLGSPQPWISLHSGTWPRSHSESAGPASTAVRQRCPHRPAGCTTF